MATAATANKKDSGPVGEKAAPRIRGLEYKGDLLRWATVAAAEFAPGASDARTGHDRRGASRASLAQQLQVSGQWLAANLKRDGRSVNEGPPTALLRGLDMLSLPDTPYYETLIGLRTRLGGEIEHNVSVPASWLPGLLEPLGSETSTFTRRSSPTEELLLCQAAALVAALPASGVSFGAAQSRYTAHIPEITEHLLLLGMGPPSALSGYAHYHVAHLMRRAFDVVFPKVEWSIRNHPLGFRSWRPITRYLQLLSAEADGYQEPPPNLRMLLLNANNLRVRSIYPARSLDIEALRSSSVHDPVFDELLLARARDPRASARERTLAALTLVDRARHRVGGDDDHPDVAAARERVGTIAALFEQETGSGRENGILWAARVLRAVSEGKPTSYIPDDNETYRRVARHGRPPVDERISITPNSAPRPFPAADILTEGLTFLIVQAVLQPHGVLRREALDTLRASNTNHWAAKAFTNVLNETRAYPFIQSRAAFAIGVCGSVSPTDADEALIAAADELLTRLDEEPRDVERDEALHTCLFALGDRFGDRDATPPLVDLLERALSRTPALQPSLSHRAAAYAAAILRMSGPGLDLQRQLLAKAYRSSDDDLVRDTAAYGYQRLLRDPSRWGCFGHATELQKLLDREPT